MIFICIERSLEALINCFGFIILSCLILFHQSFLYDQFAPLEEHTGQIASPRIAEREIFPRNFYLQYRNDIYMYRKVFLSSIKWSWFYASINNTLEIMKAFVKGFLPLRPVSCSYTHVLNPEK